MVIAGLETYEVSKQGVPYYKLKKEGKSSDSLKKVANKNESKKDYTNCPDIELLDSFIISKDELAFNEIFNRYYDKTCHLALKIIGDVDEAEDIVQEVFVKLLTGIQNFRGDSKFSTWLYAITLNTIRMRFRGLKKKKLTLSIDNEAYSDLINSSIGLSDAGNHTKNPESININRELAEELYKALDTLPRKSREVFLLREREEYTNVEVANRLGMSLPAVKSRIHRTRNLLKNNLNP